jgi:fucose 4-O-acetylase-like acetyltransferase
MPVLIFLSGYFTRGSFEKIQKGAVTGCLVPYLVFQLAYGALFFTPRSGLTESLTTNFNLFMPQWTLWYLLSLFFWKLMIGPFSALRRPMIIAVLLSVYAGTTASSTFLSLSRTFAFFPYFLAGYLISEGGMKKLRGLNKAGAAGLLLGAAGLITLFDLRGLQVAYLRMSEPYAALRLALWEAALLRLGLLCVGFAFIAGFCPLIWERRSALTILGTNSLSVYLLHSGALRLMEKFFPIRFSGSAAAIAGAAASAAVMCVLFGNPWIHHWLRKALKAIGEMIT